MKRRSFLKGLVATIAALPAALARSAPAVRSSCFDDEAFRRGFLQDIMHRQDLIVMRQLGLAGHFQ